MTIDQVRDQMQAILNYHGFIDSETLLYVSGRQMQDWVAALQGDGVFLSWERVERILKVTELAHEWINAPEDSGIGRRAEDALTYAVDALQPGDLDPLPKTA